MQSKTKKIVALGALFFLAVAASFSMNVMQGSVGEGSVDVAGHVASFGGTGNLAAASRKFKLAFTNALTLDMPAASVEPRFTRARDACMNDEKLKCILIEAALNLDPGGSAMHSATLRVRLPHESVDVFETSVLAPLPGEAPGQVGVRDRTTSAEDLSKDAEDTDAQLRQLDGYRASLEALLGKPGAKIEDLLKIKQELAGTQAQIEQLTSRKRDIGERVDTELVVISMRTADGMGDRFSEVRKAWRRSGKTFGESAGAALHFTFAVIPWVPLILLAFFGLHLFLREPRKKDGA